MNKGKQIAIALTVAVFIMMMSGCARNNWRQQYSGNEHREVTPQLLEILTNPDKKINKDNE